MKLLCYQIHADAPELIPARAARAWMDATASRFAYRCTPLSIANATGWEILCPFPITATWNGGQGLDDLVIEKESAGPTLENIAVSIFGHGILTFHPGYLFRTDPEWGVWARGAPNLPKDGIAPLDGLVETDWLPFTFTMNWMFTRPGTVRFDKGEPFCFIVPLPHMDLEAIQPEILPLSAAPELEAEHRAWANSRQDFNQKLREPNSAARKEKWQRFYLHGESPKAAVAPDTHRVKRKLAAPKAATKRTGGQAVATRRKPPHRHEAEAASQRIIWIASYPKSGNTWVRAFLHNLLGELSGKVGDAYDINRLNEHTSWEISAAPYEKILDKPIKEASRAEIARLRTEVQGQLASRRTGPFFVKTHLCFGTDYRHPTINLDATLAAIYVVRNPLDVAISYARHSGQSIDNTILNMAMPGLPTMPDKRNVYEVMGSWSQHVASWLGITDRPVHLLRYEDMLAAPERTFAVLARFLRLSPSKDQLQRAIAKSSFSELKRQEQANGFNERPPTAEQFFREGRANQWRDVLSREQIEAICTRHTPVMQRVGYLLPDCGARIGRAGTPQLTKPDLVSA